MTKETGGPAGRPKEILRVWAFPMGAAYAAACFVLALTLAAAAWAEAGQWGAGAAVGALLCLGVWLSCKKSLVRFTFTPEGFVRSGKYRRLVRWEELRGAGSYAPGPGAGGMAQRVVFLMTEDLPEIEIYRHKITQTVAPGLFMLAYRQEVLEFLAEHLPLTGWQREGDKELYRRVG